jgi:hypothetical protein
VQTVKKIQWPETVGMAGDDAVRLIRQETGNDCVCLCIHVRSIQMIFIIGLTNVNLVPENAPITMDYRTDRIRVFVNAQGIVSMVPNIS